MIHYIKNLFKKTKAKSTQQTVEFEPINGVTPVSRTHANYLQEQLDFVNNSEWRLHDGGSCPVDPNVFVDIPAGTYYSENGYFRCLAKNVIWRDCENSSLKDEIRLYRLSSEAKD